MMFRRSSTITFYVMVGYIFIAFAWWVYLLIKINNESFVERRDLLELNYASENPGADFMTSEAHQAIERERARKVAMITGEGATFFLILILMTLMMQRALRRESKMQQQQKNFLLSITHELRSPIASSKVAMQTLIKYPLLEGEKKAALLNNSVGDMDRLQTLVENLLLAAKIEDHTFSIGHEACNLSEIVLNTAEKAKQLAGCQHRITMDVTEGLAVVGDRISLTSVITNLIENAVKYSAENTTIHLSLVEEHGNVIFRIADNGLGIPDEEKKKIFQKFYRIGQEETRRTKGTGLGLYIVQKVLELHRGTVTVANNNPKGSVFEVALPRA